MDDLAGGGKRRLRPEALGAEGPLTTSPSTRAGMPLDDDFSGWNRELRQRAAGRDAALLDLDALDNNVDTVRAQLGSRFAIRLVTKSLPSVPLLGYILRRLRTDRLMAFSEGIVAGLLQGFGDDVDILLGRPMAVEGAGRILSAFSGLEAARQATTPPTQASRVRWLVDTPERAAEYVQLAHVHGRRLRVAIEIDVGLRRGGARTTQELLDILAVLAASPQRVHLVGFMGYDGHVPYAPPGFDSDMEFAAVQARYAEFLEVGKQAYPSLWDPSLVLNTGGSVTYARYVDTLDTPANELAIGSAFVLPSNFSDLAPLGLRPTTYFATPVLKRIVPAELPFALGYLPAYAVDHPEFGAAYYMTSGAFPGDVIWPAGLVLNPWINVNTNVVNVLPMQSLLNGPTSLSLNPGDFVFSTAWEGDGIVWLDSLDVFACVESFCARTGRSLRRSLAVMRWRAASGRPEAMSR